MCVVCGMRVGVEVRERLGYVQSQIGTDWNKGLSGAPKSWMAAQPICAVFFARPLAPAFHTRIRPVCGQGQASSQFLALGDPWRMRDWCLQTDSKGCRVSDLMPGHLAAGNDSTE